MANVVGLSSGLYVLGGHPLLVTQSTSSHRFFDTRWDGAAKMTDRLQWFKAAQRAALAAASATGAVVLHATTLLAPTGEAWLVLGERSSGKSTLAAAWFKLANHRVLADDYAVIRQGAVLVGPRLLPVRPNTGTLLTIDTVQSCADLPHDCPTSAILGGALWIRTGPKDRMEVLSDAQARYEVSRRTMGHTGADAAWLAVRNIEHVRLTRPFASRHVEGTLERVIDLLS